MREKTICAVVLAATFGIFTTRRFRSKYFEHMLCKCDVNKHKKKFKSIQKTDLSLQTHPQNAQHKNFFLVFVFFFCSSFGFSYICLLLTAADDDGIVLLLYQRLQTESERMVVPNFLVDLVFYTKPTIYRNDI